MTTRRRKSLLDPSDSHWDREITHDLKEGPYTYTHFNRDDIRRLLMSTRMLEQLLKRAEAEDLPAMSTWMVTPFSVVGELSTIGGPDPAGCREAFMAWVQALELDRHEFGQPDAPANWWNEHQHDGQVELRGARKLPAPGSPHLDVAVSIRAFWWTHDEETGGKS